MRAPALRLIIHDLNGRPLFVTAPHPVVPDGEGVPGSRYHVKATIENNLAPGRYTLNCRVSEDLGPDAEPKRSPAKWLQFEVEGESEMGVVIAQDSFVEIEPAGVGEEVTP
jgi:hypothetical protein